MSISGPLGPRGEETRVDGSLMNLHMRIAMQLMNRYGLLDARDTDRTSSCTLVNAQRRRALLDELYAILLKDLYRR